MAFSVYNRTVAMVKKMDKLMSSVIANVNTQKKIAPKEKESEIKGILTDIKDVRKKLKNIIIKLKNYDGWQE